MDEVKPQEFSFAEFDKPKEVAKPTEAQKDVAESPFKRKINFQEIPEDAKEIIDENKRKALIDKYMQEEAVPMATETSGSSSYLTLVLNPNLRELELMIRGLEYVKRFNPITQKEEIILRKIKDHPLNEYGINRIMAELKVYCSPEIKLGRKQVKDYYNSVQHVCHSIVRLIYKNLKNFGMDSQVKQRNAKTICNSIIEFVDASFSRSIEGKENSLSRATEFRIEGNIDTLDDPSKLFTKKKKDELKN